MPPKPVAHSLTLTFFADVEDLASVMDYVHSSEYLDYHLEARSADRWTALSVFARPDAVVVDALHALGIVHEKARKAHLTA